MTEGEGRQAKAHPGLVEQGPGPREDDGLGRDAGRGHRRRDLGAGVTGDEGDDLVDRREGRQ
jgi:hypothetical protein